LDLFGEAWTIVNREFYGPLPSNRDQIYGAIRGALRALDDPYTVLVEPISRKFEQDDLRGSYGGVGVDLRRDELGRVVLSPVRGSPAENSGIQEGDVLVAVDGVTITGEMDLSQDVASRIRGEVGTPVTLSVLRAQDTQEIAFTITRQVIEIPSVDWRTVEEAPALGYIQIKSFSDRTAQELGRAVKELRDQQVQALILDLRNNGGGLLQASIDAADAFLDGGVILYERRRGEPEKTYAATDGGAAADLPLVVLVNGGTASASEIVAGAIQDRDRGILVGEPTFGKGSVQLIFDLSDGSSLHVTAARWYTPERHLIDGVGLTPDRAVEGDALNESDPQLQSAIGILETELFQN
jgi:carboxyl-terminal processing protease